MKKLLLTIATLALGITGYANDLTWNSAQEDFNTFNGGKTVNNYTTTGTENGWEATNSAIVTAEFMGETDGIANLGPALNGKTTALGTLTSPTLTDGLGILKFNWGFTYSDTQVGFTVNIKQNNEVVKTNSYSATNLEKGVAYEYEFNVNITGDFVIEILNDGYGNKSNSNTERVVIWNVEWTNCDHALADPGLAFSTETVNVTGLVENFEAPELSKVTDGALSWTSDNETVATVDQTGKVTIKNYGSARITVTSEATETYSAGQAAYTIAVTPGTTDVATAMQLLSEGLTFDATVEGYVVKIGTFNATYGSLTYWIADSYEASTTYDNTNSIQIYGGLWIEGAQFTGTSDLTLGASISVKGSLVMYNGDTPEFSLNSEVVAYDDSEVGGNTEVTPTPDPSDPFEGAQSVTFDFTDPASLGITITDEILEAKEYSLDGVTLKEGIISWTSTDGEGASTGIRLYYGTSNNVSTWSYRFYNNTSFTISCEAGYTILGIEFTGTNLGTASVVWEGEGVFSRNTWISDENVEVSNIVVSKTATGNNPTISAATVYYTQTTGVSNLESTVDAPAVYYNLQGVRVNNPAKGQLLIKRQGDKATKVIF